MRGCAETWLDCHIKDSERASVRIDDPGADPGKISLLEFGRDTGFHYRSPSELALRFTPNSPTTNRSRALSSDQQDGSSLASGGQLFVEGCRAPSAVCCNYSFRWASMNHSCLSRPRETSVKMSELLASPASPDSEM